MLPTKVDRGSGRRPRRTAGPLGAITLAALQIKVQENEALTPPTPSTLVRPFTVAISDSEIEDLKQRLARTRAESGNRPRLVARCPLGEC